MITGRGGFNIYLTLLCVASLCCACQTSKTPKKDDPSKQKSSLRVHIEVVADSLDFHVAVPVYRENPVMVNVDKDPFLTEADVDEAKVVEVLGGYDLQIKFNRRGSWILENYTTANPGRHLAIFSLFGKKADESRWLAAPVIRQRMPNGVLSFPPDASRAETERIALGLNNAAKKNRKNSQW
jgi:preprotein translocase subunit SecD